MAEWKNNKTVAIVAGVIGIILVIFALYNIIKTVSVPKPAATEDLAVEPED